MATGDFNHKRFDFVEQGLLAESHESFVDTIEDKIFKFKYRKATDFGEVFEQRQKRVLQRFVERLEHRDPMIEEDVAGIMRKSEIQTSSAAIMLGEADVEPYF